jgi:hypothetical protein
VAGGTAYDGEMLAQDPARKMGCQWESKPGKLLSFDRPFRHPPTSPATHLGRTASLFETMLQGECSSWAVSAHVTKINMQNQLRWVEAG